MATNKDQNIIKHPEGGYGDASPEIKTPSLSDLGIDGAFIKDTIKPLLKDIVVQGVRDQLGLKKSELRKGSKAYNWATFLKEITAPLIYLAIASVLIFTFTKLFWRWVGL